MTLRLPFLARFFSTLAPPAAKPHEAAGKPEEPGVYRLAHPLIITAVRASNRRDSFNIFASEMGPTSLMFRTDKVLSSDEVLEIQMLLQGVGTLRMLANVEWTLQAGVGVRGRLLFASTSQQQIAILGFLHRQKNRQR